MEEQALGERHEPRLRRAAQVTVAREGLHERVAHDHHDVLLLQRRLVLPVSRSQPLHEFNPLAPEQRLEEAEGDGVVRLPEEDRAHLLQSGSHECQTRGESYVRRNRVLPRCVPSSSV